MEKKQKIKKGVEINAGIRQIIVSTFMILILFVAPAFYMSNYERIEDYIHSDDSNPYSAESINQRDQQGEVAGINTSSNSAKVSNLDLDANIYFVIAGAVFSAIAIFLTLFLTLGKFN